MSYNQNFQHVIIVQEYIVEGSLKDIIYKKVHLILSHCSWFSIVCINIVLKAAADADWSEKYRRRSKGLPKKKVILYGRQVLEVT